MYEHLSTFPGGQPNDFHLRLYSEWARHRWGMVITGNVQVAADHLSLGRDIVLPENIKQPSLNELRSFEMLAQTIRGSEIKNPPERNDDHSRWKEKTNRTLAILQLNHTGRQSSNFIGGRWPFRVPVGPSAVRVGSTPGRNLGYFERLANALLFQTPTALHSGEIRSILDRFVEGAVFAQKTGFDGVQLHAAHGYLLAQFLSPQTNQRTDEYSYEKALDLLQTIVTLIRSSTSKDFVIGIKLNVADYASLVEPESSTSLTAHEQGAMQHLSDIASWGLVDFVEISGGDYETPEFMAAEPTSDSSSSPKGKDFEARPAITKSRRQAFFAHVSQQVLKQLSASNPSNRPLILLTGGLNSPTLLTTALASKHADLLGIGRASVLSPNIPSILKSLATGSSSHPINPNEPFFPPPSLSNPSILSQPPISWLWSLLSSVKFVGAGTTTAWYTLHIRKIAMMPLRGPDGRRLKQPKPDYNIGGIESLLRMFLWVLPSGNIGLGSRCLQGLSFVVACVVVGFVSYWLATTAGDTWTLSATT
ncbi:hypothetical protein CPB83DRAFT_480515 [Crepidotus variabilis]|uniref:NADH:flavin oxidoreductase/NADH oxidase N-terminal domain-containing protein n=1 Tax=Crepidotus variabilis TaxID=179855 RepID=A0A9P6ERX2_9AGAR|nr:hypothetical protein CPB83DRAFT_480515 [Crepidotus variabilis]